MTGTLYVVGTPIGNLEDLTFRALRVLKEVDLIAAEDTRRTSRLLAHYEVRKPLVSVREHNEGREAPRVVERLRRGLSVALVTDAGTPGIADPGGRVVHAVREAGLPVVPIPGASAVATALSASGFTTSEFAFMGFPPRSGTARQEWFDRLAADARVIVFFEAPHRSNRTLTELVRILVNRHIIVFRELTKIHEISVDIPNSQAVADLQPLGELTVVVGPDMNEPQQTGVDDAVRVVGLAMKVSPQAVRKALKKYRISVNQQKTARP
jgi:16S rRNA (cytidine1402-2'-O)-methyltransferase